MTYPPRKIKVIFMTKQTELCLSRPDLQQKMDPGEGPDASSFQQRRHKEQAEKWGWPEDRQMDYVSKMMVLRMAPNVKEAYFLVRQSLFEHVESLSFEEKCYSKVYDWF